MTPMVKQTRTLLVTLALPDFNCEDLTQEQADEWFEGDLQEMVTEAMCLIEPTVRVLFATGDKGGNELQDIVGKLVKVEIRDREPAYEAEEHERMTEMVADWRREQKWIDRRNDD